MMKTLLLKYFCSTYKIYTNFLESMNLVEYIEKFNLDIKDNHEVGPHIWQDESLDEFEQLTLAFKLYELNPGYSACMYIDQEFNYLSKSGKFKVLDFYRNKLLTGTIDDVSIIGNALDVDIFECTDSNQMAWNYLVNDYSNTELLKILIMNASAIPFTLKDKAYMKLLKNHSNHSLIFKSITDGIFGYSGQSNFLRIRVILDFLKIDKSTDNFKKVYQIVHRFNSKQAYLKSKD